MGGKCPLCVGKLDLQAVARKLDEKDDMNELITKRKEVKKKGRQDYGRVGAAVSGSCWTDRHWLHWCDCQQAERTEWKHIMECTPWNPQALIAIRLAIVWTAKMIFGHWYRNRKHKFWLWQVEHTVNCGCWRGCWTHTHWLQRWIAGGWNAQTGTHKHWLRWWWLMDADGWNAQWFLFTGANRKHNSVMVGRWSGIDCIGVIASRQNEQNGST